MRTALLIVLTLLIMSVISSSLAVSEETGDCDNDLYFGSTMKAKVIVLSFQIRKPDQTGMIVTNAEESGMIFACQCPLLSNFLKFPHSGDAGMEDSRTRELHGGIPRPFGNSHPINSTTAIPIFSDRINDSPTKTASTPLLCIN